MKRRKQAQKTASAVPEPIKVAAKIAGLNARQKQIFARHRRLETEMKSLDNEWNANELRRAELLREFDTVAKQ